MNKRNLALMAASITLMTFASTWPISAVADPTQALQRDRPGQRQRIGDHGQAALKFVTAAQVELAKGDGQAANNNLRLADDEIVHMHPKATVTPSDYVKGRPDVSHMQDMRADLRVTLTSIKKGDNAMAQARLKVLKNRIMSMMH